MKCEIINTGRTHRLMKWGGIKKLILFSFLMIIVSLAGCSSAGKQSDMIDQQRAVKVMEVYAKDNPVSLNYIGTIDSEELVKYSFKVSGQIIKFFVAEGDRVSAGDPLAKLDTKDLEFQLAAAQAVMDGAEASVIKTKEAADYANIMYDRNESLYMANAISKDALDQTQLKKNTAAADYLQAKSQYAAAGNDYDYKQYMLDNSVIYARQDGYVAQKVCSENERVSAFTPALVVRSTAQVVNIGIPQRESAQIYAGLAAMIVVDDVAAEGTVSSISEIPDESTHTYKAEITIADKSFRLGSLARVSVNVGSQNGIWVPLTAIFADGGEKCVYVVKDERAYKRTVEILNISEDQVRVSKLNNGELLVISGMTNLDDGVRVKVQDRE